MPGKPEAGSRIIAASAIAHRSRRVGTYSDASRLEIRPGTRQISDRQPEAEPLAQRTGDMTRAAAHSTYLHDITRTVPRTRARTRGYTHRYSAKPRKAPPYLTPQSSESVDDKEEEPTEVTDAWSGATFDEPRLSREGTMFVRDPVNDLVIRRIMLG